MISFFNSFNRMAEAVDESAINIDSLDLEDKLKWLKEILENGRERFGQLEGNGSLTEFINELAVRVLYIFKYCWIIKFFAMSYNSIILMLWKDHKVQLNA